MPARLRSLLPQGFADLLRQVLLFCGAYWLYRLVRGQVDTRAAAAFDNARHVIDLEQTVGLFVEPGVHHWASRHPWLIDACSWMYVNSHFAVTTVALAFLYLRRNERFYFVRNMFMVAMAIALVGYVAFPTAPPRFMPEYGFYDSVAAFTGVSSEASNALVNPYAAVPSMHVAFALMLGFSLAQTTRRRAARAAWRAYPLAVTFVVVATANHWWFDALLGAATAAVSALAAAGVFARLRPDAWAWDAAQRPASA